MAHNTEAGIRAAFIIKPGKGAQAGISCAWYVCRIDENMRLTGSMQVLTGSSGRVSSVMHALRSYLSPPSTLLV
jgi:hypothetical protein